MQNSNSSKIGFKKPIHVTQPDLPDLKEFTHYLEQIWENKQLTNGGPFHQELENRLCDYLGVKYISLFANGTLALLTALKVLNITGEVITTPYSFPATTNSLLWNHNIPVFVDIEPHFGNIDTAKIEAAITPRTSAILPVHVYGNPCEVVEIDKIAKKHSLKVIYDAAHCFGVKTNSQPLVNYGDLSVLSFHATKVFNTMEGGAIVSHDAPTKLRIDSLKNFGFMNDGEIYEPGINSKMNEMQAALGILQLKNQPLNIQSRKAIFERYQLGLKGIQGISFIDPSNLTEPNYAYFPIIINQTQAKLTRDQIHDILKMSGILTRKYFYPVIPNYKYYHQAAQLNITKLPIAEQLASKVLCLPIYPALELSNQSKIIETIKSAFL